MGKVGITVMERPCDNARGTYTLKVNPFSTTFRLSCGWDEVKESIGTCCAVMIHVE